MLKCLLHAVPTHRLNTHLSQWHGFTLKSSYEVHVLTFIKPCLCPTQVAFFSSQCMNTASHLNMVEVKKYISVSLRGVCSVFQSSHSDRRPILGYGQCGSFQRMSLKLCSIASKTYCTSMETMYLTDIWGCKMFLLFYWGGKKDDSH